jgi:hypothetical protein
MQTAQKWVLTTALTIKTNWSNTMRWEGVGNILLIVLFKLHKTLVFRECRPSEHRKEHWQTVDIQNICKSRLPEAMRKSNEMRAASTCHRVRFVISRIQID